MNNMLTGRCILIVEDDMMIRLTLEDMLGDLGCVSVGAAGTIEQALALIETHRFDAATLDVNLNGKNSFSVAAALAVQGVPFVFSTGYGEHFLRDGYAHRPILKSLLGRRNSPPFSTTFLPMASTAGRWTSSAADRHDIKVPMVEKLRYVERSMVENQVHDH